MSDISDDPVEAPAGQYWDIHRLAEELREARADWRGAHRRHAEHGAASFPSRDVLKKVIAALAGALFPLRLGPSFVREHNEDAFVADTLQTALSRLYGQIRLELGYAAGSSAPELIDEDAGRIIGQFAHALPGLRRLIDTDVEATYAGDPGARSVDEVLICYPGAIAVAYHRLAHRLHGLGAPLVARIISEIASAQTGIDIHPGAAIGQGFFIEHGTGVAIGETAIIGNRVRLHQGVTLGARTFPAKGSLRGGLARHPIIEDDVVIHAGATILGRVTIGAGSMIGGNVWLTENVPPGSIVRQAEPEQDVGVPRAGRAHAW